MRKIFSSKYNNFFNGGLLLVIFTFLWARPLNSPSFPYIAGDGLGYYAYLPAKFIHHDAELNYKWFNKVYNANYIYSTFENPEDNLLVEYHGRRINKYYQGLSYIWMPFFFAGHLLARLTGFPADGFSAPYQFMIGLASLVFLLLGLILLRLLLLRLFKVQWIAVLVPFLIFYGTPLYVYAIFCNTLSHAYSFTFTTGFLYFSLRFFRDPGRKTLMLLMASLMLVITVCIRPLNGLSFFLCLAFVPPDFFTHRIVLERIRLLYILPMALTIGALVYQARLTYLQTGSVLAYTYSGEKFDFAHNRFLDAIASYYLGMLQFMPLLILGLLGLLLVFRRNGWFMLLFFLGIVFLYSSWWYWPIVRRALIDFYAVPAIGLAALLNGWKNKLTKSSVILICCLSAVFFQFKSWQMSAGILDEFLTYRELYWRHFFRISKAYTFSVPPSSILATDQAEQTFETGSFITTEGHPGKALLLDHDNYICTVLNAPFPALFNRPERRKVRLSFDLNTSDEKGQVHAFIDFRNDRDSTLFQAPFYLSDDHLHADTWDHMEFGYDLQDRDLFNAQKVSRLDVTFWNVEGRRNVRIDNVKLEYMLTDESFDTTK